MEHTYQIKSFRYSVTVLNKRKHEADLNYSASGSMILEDFAHELRVYFKSYGKPILYRIGGRIFFERTNKEFSISDDEMATHSYTMEVDTTNADIYVLEKMMNPWKSGTNNGSI